MEKQITIKELARIAGTSVSTVSKALNDSHEISEEVKKQIRELARRYHYRPNQIARSLRSQKSRTIGMLIPDNANLYYAGLLKGAEDAARANGYTIVIGNTDENEQLEKEQLGMMLGLQVAGLLATPVTEKNYDHIDIPFVFLSRCRLDEKSKRYHYAINDDFKGAYLAAEHLIRQGKKNLFFISGPARISIAEQRTAGFRKALETYGLEFKEENVLYDNIAMEQGYEAFQTIVRENDPPFGVFCSSDNLAIGVLAAAREKGFRIPEDLGLVGYDDIETLKYLDFPLTTIGQAITQIGAQGAKILTGILSEKAKYDLVNQVVFEPKLIVRNT